MYNTLTELDLALTHNWEIAINNKVGTTFRRNNTRCWQATSDNQWVVAVLINGQYVNHTRFDALTDALEHCPRLED